jgi:predicted peroxiredoxin
MSRYLFIDSRDGFESRDTPFVEETAISLRARGHEVILFLVQNGVLTARQNGRENGLRGLHQAGVTILADDFSLCERGIQAAELIPGIQLSNMTTLVEALVQDDTKAIWH